ncbi:unnamed protein product [Malus baccata var. baccata]
MAISNSTLSIALPFPTTPSSSSSSQSLKQQLLLAPSSLRPAAPITTSATSRRAVTPSGVAHDQTSELPDTTWDTLGINKPMSTDYMFVMKSSKDANFLDGGLQRFEKIEFNPAACVLNYGQGIIEELKAYKKPDGSILLFHLEEHGLRMRTGAERLCMPAPTVEQFVEGVKATVLANRRWVPPRSKGFLHIRPLLIGNGPVLSLTPAPEFTFLIYVSPMGNYFEVGLQPIDLVVENEIHRAVRGGAGSVKAIGNYGAAQVDAKANGFSDVLYLDSVHNRYIEETSTANIFLVKDNVISTPALHEGTILPGITRNSVIEIARIEGYQVEERLVSFEELFEADEVFCTGNAVLTPVRSITYLDKRVSYLETGPGGVVFAFWVVRFRGRHRDNTNHDSKDDKNLGVYRCFGTVASPNAEQASDPFEYSYDLDKHEYADVDWDNLGFGLVQTDYMYVMKCSNDGKFEQGQLRRYGNIELNPAAGVLNYGQAIYEGTKAHRKKDGNLLLFRPDQNAMRMKIGAERMCMPSLSVDQFIDAVKQTAQANKRWVPPPGKGSLYIRPLLLGSGPILGLAPSPEYTFLTYASPVRNYFKEGSAPLNVYVEEEYDRASRGGAGGVKTITNYAPVLKALTRAKSKGFSDVLYLDSVHNKNLEEVSSCNIFIVKGNVISTPATSGTILSGVTRRSIIEIARDHGYQVEERVIPVEELSEADEVFCTGTAVGVAPVGSITYQGKRMEYKTGAGTACPQLYSTLVGIQTGQIEDKKGWIVEID